MAIIPQDCFVFGGTLRFNLDPFNKFSDIQILDILIQTKFDKTFIKQKQITPKPISNKPPISSNNENNENIIMTQFETNELAPLKETLLKLMDNKALLNFQIESGGQNLSLGQKQLICIVRALLKTPQILLMDEATSNVDENTSDLIQKIIKKKFRDVTIGRFKFFK
jgi:ABC-type multidrug transport system fused ATPase/permease subunit